MSTVIGPRPGARHTPAGNGGTGCEEAGRERGRDHARHGGRAEARRDHAPRGRPPIGGAPHGGGAHTPAPNAAARLDPVVAPARTPPRAAWPRWADHAATGRRRAVAGSRRLLGEWRALVSEPLARLRRGRLPVAFGSAAAVLVLWALRLTPRGARVVAAIGGVSPSTPLHLVVLRLPASMFTAAPNLPVWGSLLQVFVVFALAEAWLGRARTLTVALGATLVCTLSGRVMCALGPHTVVGLPWIERYADDTGPSAAVVALAVYLCCVRRAPRTLALVLAVMVTEVALLPNLAGREHLVAIAMGLLAAAAVPAAGRIRLVGQAACHSLH